MNKSNINVCKYPVAVVMIDDDRDHLKGIKFFLNKNKIQCHAYQDSSKALELLNQENVSDYWLRFDKNLSNILSHSSTARSKSDNHLDVNHLWEIIKTNDRFNDVGVIVVDKQMPRLDGIEFLKSLRNRGSKIIMMTGYHDAQDVIQLMQDGLIDAYIQKQSDDSDEQLLHYIKKLENDYFSLSNSFAERYMPGISSILNNKDFCEVHNYYQEKYNIDEYYMIDIGCSYLMIDGDGKGYIFGIVHKGELEAYQFELDLAEKPVPKEVYKAVKNGEKAPFFLHLDRNIYTPDRWNECLYAIRKFPNSDMYYIFIDDISKYGFDLSDMKTYNAFCTQSKNNA